MGVAPKLCQKSAKAWAAVQGFFCFFFLQAWFGCGCLVENKYWIKRLNIDGMTAIVCNGLFEMAGCGFFDASRKTVGKTSAVFCIRDRVMTQDFSGTETT